MRKDHARFWSGGGRGDSLAYRNSSIWWSTIRAKSSPAASLPPMWMTVARCLSWRRRLFGKLIGDKGYLSKDLGAWLLRASGGIAHAHP